MTKLKKAIFVGTIICLGVWFLTCIIFIIYKIDNGIEVKQNNKIKMERMQFLKDSLQVEYLKRKLK